MKVLGARVDWKEGYANDPRLQVLVDDIPSISDMRFEHEDGLWYAEKDGFVRYYSWRGPDNEGGFCGRHYELQTVDGESVTLKGPWSSRAGCLNLRGFGPCVDVSLTTDKEVLERGHTFQGGAITLEAAKEAVDLVGGCHLERRLKFMNDEPYWVVRRNGGDD